MHQVYLVAIPKDSAETASEAIAEAQSELDSNSFAGEGGFFTNHKADWYVMGGRWADLLVERHDWAKQAKAEIDQMLSENRDAKGEIYRLRGTHYGSSEAETKQAELREKAELIWGRHRPEDYPKVRYYRWADEDGKVTFHAQNDDCAELSSPELLKYLADYSPEIEVFFPEDYEETNVKYLNEKSDEYDGTHWLCVVDYHI